MSSTYGDKIKISVFGESHGNGIGVVIDGLPAGFEVDFDRVLTQMARRAGETASGSGQRGEGYTDLKRV